MKGPGRSSDGQAGMGDEPLPLAFEAGVEGIVGKHARRGVDAAHPAEHDIVRKADGCAGRAEGRRISSSAPSRRAISKTVPSAGSTFASAASEAFRCSI